MTASGTIRIERAAKRWSDRKRAYKVMIDGSEAGRVGNGESAELEVTLGRHEVFFRIDWARSQTVSVDVTAGETLRIGCEARSPFAAIYWATLGSRRYVKITTPT